MVPQRRAFNRAVPEKVMVLFSPGGLAIAARYSDHPGVIEYSMDAMASPDSQLADREANARH